MILPRDVVFIDGNVGNIGELLRDLHPDVEVHILDLQSDGVEQIAGILDGREELSAVHIFSHGGQGFLNLGSGQLSSEFNHQFSCQCPNPDWCITRC